MVFSELIRAYPWAFCSTVVSPVVVAIVAIVAAFFSARAGIENLEEKLRTSQQSQLSAQRSKETLEGLSKLMTDDAQRQSTLRLLESYKEKLDASGKRDEKLVAIINQYQQLQRVTAVFHLMTHQDSSSGEGKVAREILEIINQDMVRTLVRDDLPGKPLMIELQPNSFRVIYPAPMRRPPDLTFTGLPDGVVAQVSDKSEISFTASFFPASIPVKTFGFIAEAEL
jgi:hypothetical protein